MLRRLGELSDFTKVGLVQAKFRYSVPITYQEISILWTNSIILKTPPIRQSVFWPSMPAMKRSFECPKSVRSVELHFHRIGRVSIRIFGAEREGIYFRDELKEIIYGMQPWYGWIARRLASYLRTIFVLTTWIVFLAYLYIVMGPIVIVAPKPEWSPMFEATAVTVGVMLITWVPFWVINNVISALQVRMFPVVAFATGQGEKRQKHAEVGRVLTLTVVSGGIVSLLVGGFFIVV